MTAVMENSTDVNCATNVLATYQYDTLSRRKQVTYGNADSIAYSFSNAGDLLTLNHVWGGSPHYTFTYTNAHELLTEDITNSLFVWQPPGTDSSTGYTSNTLNQYTAIGAQISGGTDCSTHATQGLSYDCNGNLTYDGNLTFGYDAENRLLTASKTGLAASYQYDPLGRRTRKSGTGVTDTFFLSDGADEIAEYDGTSGALTERYIPGPAIDEPVAMVDGTTGAKEYFHANHQGSIIAMTGDSGGRVEGPFKYDPYGNCFAGSSPCSTGEPYRFTGRRLDPETGLYYYRARYYDPNKGRFLQTDPVGYTADLNLYTYVGNDPANKADPSGQTWSELLTDPQASAAAVEALSGIGLMILGGGGDAGSAAAEGITLGGATPLAAPAAIASTGLIVTGGAMSVHGTSTLANIVARSAPEGNGGDTETPHGSAEHDAEVNRQVQKMRDQNYTDIRKNQVQVDAQGNRVGDNRPDVQGTNPKTGQREHVEVDRDPKRGVQHEREIIKNDPSAKCTLISCGK